MALLARSRGAWVVYTTVSIAKVGGEGVMMSVSSSASMFEVDGALSSLVTVSAAGEVRGFARRSCMNLKHLFHVLWWGGVGMFFIDPLHHSLQLWRGSPDKDGVRAVQSNSSAWGGS